MLWVEEGQMSQLPGMVAVLWIEEGRTSQVPGMVAVVSVFFWAEEDNAELVSSAWEEFLRHCRQLWMSQRYRRMIQQRYRRMIQHWHLQMMSQWLG